jgi:hypothetical protein
MDKTLFFPRAAPVKPQRVDEAQFFQAGDRVALDYP